MAPRWPARQSRSVARGVLALAQKRRVVDSLDRLINRNSGLPVLEGSMLAVAAAVVRLTKRDKVSAEEVVEDLMPLGSYPKPVAGTYGPADRVVQDVQAVQDDSASEQDLPEWLGGSSTTGQAAGAAADPQGVDERMDEVEKTVYEMPLYRRFRDWLAETYDDVDEDSEVFDIPHLLL